MNKFYLENIYGTELVSEELAAKLVNDIIAAFTSEKPWMITAILQDDAFITDMHEKYLDDDGPTDVITFDLSEPDGPQNEGEIYISVDRALDNSKDYNVTHSSEIYRLIVHGVLHLMGMTDKTPDERKMMRQKEDEFLKKLF